MTVNVGIFTDNDFDKVNGVTTSLRAVLGHAPADVRVRLYTCDSRGANTPTYMSLKAFGVGIPFYREMKIYAPPVRRLLHMAASARLDVVHVTTPGPVGLAALWIAAWLRIPLVGSFHTHLAEYTRLLSGSKQLAVVMREYQRWLYCRCRYVFVPSEAARTVLIDSKMDASKIRLWTRGVSTTRFTPAKRSHGVRRTWGIGPDEVVLLYVGRLSREKGLEDIAPLRRARAARDAAAQYPRVLSRARGGRHTATPPRSGR